MYDRGPTGWTPLHVATGTLSERLIGWLLDHGAEVEAENVNGRTPLDTIGSRVRWDERMLDRANRIGAMLVERGAHLNASTAVRTGNVEWLRRRYAEDGLTGDSGLIAQAVVSNQPAVLAALLELGLDPDERSRSTAVEEPVFSWGEPLRQCAIARRHDMAELLLARGADPNTNVYAASTAMFNAYEAGDQKMIALLERYGGIVDANIAGFFGRVDQAKQMLEDEAAGHLHERAVWPGGTVAGALLQSGADAGHPDIIRLALDHVDWPRGDGRWHWNLMRPLGSHAVAERERFATCFRLMVERSGANVPGPYGRMILHDLTAAWPRGSLSTADERVDLATILLDAGARLDVRDDLLKSTPLGWACRWGRTELVKLLLDHGADPIEPDAEPWATPFAWATKTKHHDVLVLLRGVAE
jgi:ankyrin repeat protein